MSSDGAYVFFTSEDGLTPQAEAGVNNVYEYHNGRVSLISDGHDSATTLGRPAVRLFGTDESGQDVYFTTGDRLLPQDTDTQVDIYDARINGGFPPQPSEPACADDACQGALAGGLSQSSSLTSSSTGEGTLVAGSGKQATERSSVRPKKKRGNAKKKRHSGRHASKAKKRITKGKRR